MILRVFAMARPARPASERAAVLVAVDGWPGSCAQRGRRLGSAVARAALALVNQGDEDLLLGMLRALARDPVHILASNPEIDTARLVVAERIKRMEARGGRYLSEREWPAEDREVCRAIGALLANRYARILARERCA